MDNMMIYLIGIIAVAFAVIVIIYLQLNKKMQNAEYKKLQQLREGTKKTGFSTEVLWQKLYLTYSKIPFLKRYVLKLRRRLEILYIDDEFLTRRNSAKLLTKALVVATILVTITVVLTISNLLLMGIILIFELFMIDVFLDSSVDSIDNKLLKEQMEFFSEIRHAYHEFNMVEEAIYQVSQDDEKQISLQGDKIYEILISDDPESELEKYYDIAPNSYLKEFAGVSYLTKEFGDRKVDGASLYLKNVNNISQEMQLEILKRDKLNYVFQSLSFISIAPILGLEAIKNWSITNFAFTEDWYNGSPGMVVQILIIILTVISYVLIRTVRDNGSTAADTRNRENPWQNKLYKNKFCKKIIDLFIPKEGTKEYRQVQKKLKDSASPLKIEWLYVNRIIYAVVAFIVSVFLFIQLHNITVMYIYNEPTTDYNLFGQLTEKEELSAMEVTEQDNIVIEKFLGDMDVTVEEITKEVKELEYYESADDEELKVVSERILGKLQIINTEYLKWFEILLAFVISIMAYMSPIWIMIFQVKMREIEMEDEVMQFQTIILMLMRIERVNVEIILEWLERYSNIFRAPISKCVNNYESGSWEALEQMKEDVSYFPLVRIIESLQAAVEKIPIPDAFDELDSERDYYREKRKESNERLIKRKGMIGKVIGFAPMVTMFVGYLIVPLVFIGLTSMSTSFSTMM